MKAYCDVTLFEGREDAAVLFDADYSESTMVIFRRPRFSVLLILKTHLLGGQIL